MHTDERGLREALHRAAGRMPITAAPIAMLQAQGRRRRRRRRVGTGVLVGACAVTVVAAGAQWSPATTLIAEPETPPTSAAPPTSAVSAEWAVAPPRFTERGINGVEVTADGYLPATSSDTCVSAGRITVSSLVSAPEGCGGGPGATVLQLAARDWQGAQVDAPSLRVIDGVPVSVGSRPFTDDADDTTLVAPSRGVLVVIRGTAQQRSDLVDSITIAPDPTEQSAPVRASEGPVLLAAMSHAGEWAGLSKDVSLLSRLTELVDTAPRVEAPACVPAAADTVTLTLQTTVDSDPERDPVQEFTYLATGLDGGCGLVFSSTGAIVRPDPTQLHDVLQELATSTD